MQELANFPEIGITQSVFSPIKRASISRTQGRFTSAESEPFSYWTAEYTLAQMNEEENGKFLSFMMATAPGGNGFLAYDLRRPRPILEDTGSPLSIGAFDGTADIQSIINSKSIIVSGLPNGFRLSAGDNMEVRTASGMRSLHTIESNVTANSSGEATVNFNYALELVAFPASSIVNFEKPSCTMKRFEQFDSSTQSVLRNGSFTAQQVFENVI